MAPKTSVLSIRIDNETRKKLEKHAESLQMKISMLASLILKDCSDEWVSRYVNRIAEEYGIKSTSKPKFNSNFLGGKQDD